MHITPGKTELRCIASLRDVDMRVYIKEVMKLNICFKKNTEECSHHKVWLENHKVDIINSLHIYFSVYVHVYDLVHMYNQTKC